jgi:hypothetical protein
MNGCGKAGCYWCGFAKSTDQVVLLPTEEEGDEPRLGAD